MRDEKQRTEEIEARLRALRQRPDWPHAELNALANDARKYGTADWKITKAELGGAAGKTRRKGLGVDLDLANGLQAFVRLPDDPKEAEQFKRSYPSFFPLDFWTAVIPSTADLFRGTAVLGLAGFDLSQLPPLPFWVAYRNALRLAWRTKSDEDVIRLVNARVASSGPDPIKDQLPAMKERVGRTVDFEPIFQFQRAVWSVFSVGWRARFCGQCGEPFVADKPNRRFCSPECYGQHRLRAKTAYHETKGRFLASQSAARKRELRREARRARGAKKISRSTSARRRVRKSKKRGARS